MRSINDLDARGNRRLKAACLTQFSIGACWLRSLGAEHATTPPTHTIAQSLNRTQPITATHSINKLNIIRADRKLISIKRNRNQKESTRVIFICLRFSFSIINPTLFCRLCRAAERGNRAKKRRSERNHRSCDVDARHALKQRHKSALGRAERCSAPRPSVSLRIDIDSVLFDSVYSPYCATKSICCRFVGSLYFHPSHD